MRRALAALASALTLSALGVTPAIAADVTRVCRFSDAGFTEISGMTYSLRHPGVLWLHNDSGGGPYIYAVDSATCQTLARVTIAGVDARDIEAIAVGRDGKDRPLLWVGDLGDNLDSWPEVHVYRFLEPKELVDQVVDPRVYRVTYRDRPHNAEALLADPNSMQLWIVTKQLAHGRLYALPKTLSESEINVATPVRKEGGLITDGAVSPDGSRYVLRNYVDAEVFAGLPPGGRGERIDLPVQPQGEAVAWTTDGQALLVASERDNRLLRVEVPGPTSTPTPESSQTPPSPGASATELATEADAPTTDRLPVVGVIAALVVIAAIAAARSRSRSRS